MDHLIHQLTDHDGSGQQLQPGARVLHRQHGTHEHDRDGAGIGDQRREADQHGEQHPVGNLQQREHQQLTTAEDQRQQHLTGEVAPEGALQRAGHPFAPALRQPLRQPGCDRIGAEQQKHRQHQNDQQVDRGTDGGAEQTEQSLAELGGHQADP